MEKYEPLRGNVVPVYRFIEGDEEEEFWADAQNCDYYTFLTGEYDKETGLYNGHNWWIMWPYVPEGTKKEDVTEEIVKWFVEETSVEADVDMEWDFKAHKVL